MASGPETRRLLIEAAERLFAERGVNGVSLREIGAAAGQRNSSAVLYHLGSKRELVHAVFQHRMLAINERRSAMLAAFDEHGLGSDLRALTEAFIVPLADVLGEPGRPSWYMRFSVNTVMVDHEAVEYINAHEWSSGLRTVMHRVVAALDHLPSALRRERWVLYSGYAIHALADREAAIEHRPETLETSRQVFLADLIDTAVALLSTPARQSGSASRPSTIVSANTT